MSTEVVGFRFETDRLLSPISKEQPTGESLRYEGTYDRIADFRRENAQAFKAVCAQFVQFLRGAQLVGGEAPVVAVDGTMKKRLNDHAVAGHAHIKTGSLEGVRSLAGYVFDARGRRMAVVAIVNHPRAGAARPALDALLQWVYQRP